MTQNADTGGRYQQVEWRTPVRADGVINGKWWHYNLDERHPDNAQALFVWVPHPGGHPRPHIIPNPEYVDTDLADAARRVQSFLKAWTRPYSSYDQERIYSLHIDAEFLPRELRVSDLWLLLVHNGSSGEDQ